MSKAKVVAFPPEVETAIRVLKGAFVKKYNIPTASTTIKVEYKESTQVANIFVQLNVETEVTRAEMEEVVALANGVIAEDRPIAQFVLPRAEAEARYGFCMYDNFRRPAADQAELTLAYMPGWTLSLVVAPLLASAGALQPIEFVDFQPKKDTVKLHFRARVREGAAVDAPAPSCEPPSAEEVEVFNAVPKRAPKPKEATTEPASGGGGGGSGGGSGAGVDVSGAGGGARKEKRPAVPTEASEAPTPSGSAEGVSGAGVEGAATPSGETPTQVVNPWEVEAGEDGIDYEKLVRDFGCSFITPELTARIERLTGKKPHRFLRRGLFYSHRDLDLLLDAYEGGKPFYLYTGRGPSSEALHLGHLVPFLFTQYLQEAFDVPLVIQLTDDEKFLWKNLSLDECHRLAFENAKDIIACGFDPKKTFIFSDLDYIHRLYPNILRIQKLISYNTARAAFGFDASSNIGKSAFPAVQAAPSFSSSFPTVLNNGRNLFCLIPQAIDQDPYFRVTRDVAPRLGWKKPALIHSKFFPALQGPQTKMSASDESSSIYVTDTEEMIRTKVRKYAFTGAPKTLAEHQEKGANIAIDVPFQYLRFFLDDDEEVETIGREYGAGRMLSSAVKERLVQVLTELVLGHQRRRAAVTDDVVREFMRERALDFEFHGARVGVEEEEGVVVAEEGEQMPQRRTSDEGVSGGGT